MKASVVVCTYNRAMLLPGLLGSLMAQQGLDDPWEIIMVDNNCTDNTSDVITHFQARSPVPLRLVRETVQGLGAARNRGIQEAQGALIILTDDDCLAPKPWVAQVIRAYSAHPEADMVSGPVRLIWEEGVPWWVANPRWTLLSHYDLGEQVIVNPSSYPIGANLSFRREAVEQLGGFRNDLSGKRRLAIAAEDQEFVHRFLQAGKRVVYVPETAVDHRILKDRVRFVPLLSFCAARGIGGYLFDREYGPTRDRGRLGLRYAAQLGKHGLAVLKNLACLNVPKAACALLDAARSTGSLYGAVSSCRND